MSSDIKISDVGPIERLEIKLHPGVNVLRGRNETGKSTALRAVDAITHGRNVDLEARDGSQVGYIQGGGVMLQIGKRTKKSGTCEFMVVSDPSDISKLVDPGFADPDACTRARVRALLSLTGQTITLEQFAEQLGGVDLEGIEEGSDPVETAGRIRKHLQLLARQAERQADELQGQHKTITSQVVEFGEVEDADEETLSNQLTERIAAKSALDSRHREAERDLNQREGLRKLAGECDQRLKAWELANEKHESLRKSAVLSEHRIVSNENIVSKLREQLVAAESVLAAEKKEHSRIVEQISNQADYRNQLRSSFEDAKTAKAQIEQSPVPFPTIFEIQAAKSAVEETQNAIHRARQAREIKAKIQQAAEIEKQREAKANQSEELRLAAERIDDVLSSAVNVAGLSVKRGELVITRGKKTEPFSRLSHGARWRTAIATAAKSIRRVEGDDCLPVVAIPQEAWESQGKEFRQDIQQAAIECGVAIVTAELSEDELTAQNV